MRTKTAIVTTGILIALMASAANTVLTRAEPEAAHMVLSPADMPRIGSVDERFQSYNVEMLEVTGGRFWKPYGPELASALKKKAPAAAGNDTPAGMNPELYEYRPPIDLLNARLRKLAAALGPAYVRVSGTWANTTYFPESDDAVLKTPAGFNGLLSHEQWNGVVDFSHAVDAEIVTSFSVSAGVRNAAGEWTPDQARRLVDYTRSIGGKIAAAEFMNEPNLAAMGGAPPGYSAAAYGRDFKLFHAFARQALPDMKILGPGSVGESAAESGLALGTAGVLKSRDLLMASGDGLDGFSYHHYGAVSRRCADMGNQTTSKAALSQEWLKRTDETLAFYKALRDEFEPGKPLWLTETADAACGGNQWAATFLDTFRYLDQLGRLARQGVQVVAHNTLVASDYGLLNEQTFAPKPNYWGALLWRTLMGGVVLDPGKSAIPELHVYAHCMRGVPGGVVTLAINTDRVASYPIALPQTAERYTLSSAKLQSTTVELNDQELRLTANDALPALAGAAAASGTLVLAPATITFLAIPGAGNAACP